MFHFLSRPSLFVLMMCVFALGPGQTHAQGHTPESVCSKMMSLNTKGSVKRRIRAKRQCKRAMASLLVRYPQRFSSFASCIEKQVDIDGFKKNCAYILFGSRRATAQVMKRQMARAKAAFAKLNLYRLRTMVTAFFASHKRLPKDTGWFPSLPCCQHPNKKCVRPKTISPAAKELFGNDVIKPSFFQYRFMSHGKGKNKTFTLEAKGNVMCQGKDILFVVQGRFDKDGQPQMSKPKRTQL